MLPFATPLTDCSSVWHELPVAPPMLAQQLLSVAHAFAPPAFAGPDVLDEHAKTNAPKEAARKETARRR